MDINTGRWAARAEEGTVLFLIGMRVNRWWAVRDWWQVVSTMPKMIDELNADPELGLLGTRYLLDPPRGAMLVQYWNNAADLRAFAAAPVHTHRPAWTEFFRTAYKSGGVGIWHETYVIGEHESLYVNMPAYGLGAVGELGTTAAMGDRAAQRMGVRDGVPA